MTTSGSEIPIVRTPSSETLEVAHLIKSRLGKRDHAPVRAAFVGSNDSVRAEDEVPPLAKILRGGRGGEVRLKLELSFLWFAVNPPHDLAYPARVWALLVGLEDPDGRGTRRVRQAIAALSTAGLIDVLSRSGQPNRITLLDEGGTGAAYTLPGATYNKYRGTGEEWRHRYIQLPDSLWTNGWIATLSGAAVAMLLVLFVELGQKDSTKTDLWFSPTWAKKIYGLSEDTRSKGLRELRAAGLVSARRRSASRDALDLRRLRNTYRLEMDQFSRTASVPIDVDPPKPTGPGKAAADTFLRDMLNQWKSHASENG